MGRRVRGVAVVLAALVVVGLAAPPPARACSCVDMSEPGMLEQLLEDSGAAFVGTAAARQLARADMVVWTFDVESVVKGELPERLEVTSGADSAMCGLGMPVGQRVGLVLHEFEGQWEGNLCGQVEPEVLLALGDPQPPGPAGPPAPPLTPLDEPSAGAPLGWVATGILGLVVVAGGGAAALRRARRQA